MKLINDIKTGYAEGKAERSKSKIRVTCEAKVLAYAEVKVGEYAMKKVMSDPKAEEMMTNFMNMM